MPKLLKTLLLITTSVLFLLTLTIWILSYAHSGLEHMTPYEVVSQHPLNMHRQIYRLSDGSFEYLYHEEVHFRNEDEIPTQLRNIPLSMGAKTLFSLPGFDINQTTSLTRAFQIQHTSYALSCWPFAAAFGVFPLFRVARTTRRILQGRKARTVGYCKKCSYDLRAHRKGDKCPECGTSIEHEPATRAVDR